MFAGLNNIELFNLEDRLLTATNLASVKHGPESDIAREIRSVWVDARRAQFLVDHPSGV